MTHDAALKDLALQKYTEVTENAFAAEREVYIERLSHEITTLNEKLMLEKKKAEERASSESNSKNKKLRALSR